ncbi:hypothetical protein QRD02_04695 [Aequorivita sp. SDUM287046]|uniref:Uncharacterized protein n=1 Tax=Aequorivita aurantiaca TaxID=3053356 RepID=A0ABT8DG38_9FLAO|nr:hypothetical protein [Aequorivita aurantiaca]MDN3723669.1 hypothetical protein [Aequorivita aurantiaca]
MLFIRTVLPLIPLFFFGTATFSQNKSHDKIYKTYDKIVGLENTGLFNGTEFTDLFLNTDGSYRYFNGFDYVMGSVTYQGQYYVDVLLKYDLLEDNLLTVSDDNLSIFNVKLIPEFVESFSVHNHNFVRLSTINLGFSGNGFYEIAYLGNTYKLYIKRTKKIKDNALKSGVQYSFSPNDSYILNKDGSHSVIKSERDLRKLLPENEDEINSFYKTYKVLYKSDPDAFMIKLVKFLDGLETEKHQQ